MAIKITTDKSKKVDITAKRLDDFIVNLEIKNESGNLVEFTRDAYTYINKDTISEGDKRNSLGREDVMLFTITTEDDTPVLAACSSDLDLAMCVNLGTVLRFDPTSHFDGNTDNGGNYNNPTNQRDFDKLYLPEHVNKIRAIANAMSKASHKNTAEEQSNYGTKNLKFRKNYIESNIAVSGLGINSFIYNAEDYSDWLYNIFTNLDVVKNSFMNSELFSNSYFTGYTGNRYIFFGRVEGNNSFQIKFDHDKFNLPAGNYKYTFKSLSNMANLDADVAAGNSNGDSNRFLIHKKPNEESYIDQTTWIHGKLKINE
tara:strand:- start:770 stop:1711 length:942 start_codon:yes stop_codon:yes gene_type:complete